MYPQIDYYSVIHMYTTYRLILLATEGNTYVSTVYVLGHKLHTARYIHTTTLSEIAPIHAARAGRSSPAAASFQCR